MPFRDIWELHGELLQHNERMKTYTVDLTYLETTFSIEGAICIHGIKVAELPQQARAVIIGEYSQTGRMAKVPLCKIEPPVVTNHLVQDGHPIKLSNGTVIAKPHHENSSILVRLTTKTESGLGLVAEEWDDDVSMISSGHGFCGKPSSKWTDSLFAIPPFKTVMIKDKDETRFVVINNGGEASVITWQEYEIFFLPHIETTENGTSKTLANVAASANGNNKGARTRREHIAA